MRMLYWLPRVSRGLVSTLGSVRGTPAGLGDHVLGLSDLLSPQAQVMKEMARLLGAHSGEPLHQAAALSSVCCPSLPAGRIMVVSIAGVATGWIRVSPLQQTGMPGCGLGLRPHHIDEQKERSPPSSDRNGTLTLVIASW